MALDDRRMTTRQLAEALKISKGSVGELLKELNFHKVPSRFVPRFLTTEMSTNRLTACQKNLALYRRYGDRFLQHLITVDETPFSLYIPQSKREDLEAQNWIVTQT
jgi:hypothetical protein